MFRIYKLASVVTRTAPQNQLITVRKQIEPQCLAALHRFYSKKGERDRTGTCPPCDEKPVCNTPKPVAPDCKPSEPVTCRPPPCNQLPQFQECPGPNRMDGLPKPDCPYEKKDGSRKRKYFIILLVGTLVFLATMAALYWTGDTGKQQKKVKTKKKRPHVVKKNPRTSKDIPDSIPYLLIGGGTASFSAFRAIKSADPEAKVLVISSEGDFPYMRPPLSKEIWFNSDPKAYQTLTFKQWNGSERSLFYEPEDFYMACKELKDSPNGGVAVARGWSITHIDVVERKAYLEDGKAINYDKCLIATGALPKNLDIFAKADTKIQERVTLYRNIFDFQELYEISEESKAIAVVGGGFLGSELACSLARKGKQKGLRVYQIFREGGNMGKILPEYLSYWTTDKVKAEGVEVLPYAEVTGVKIREKDEMVVLNLSNGQTVLANHVIVAVGAEPNTEIAEQSDLEVEPELGGFLVNTELQARSHLYIAGDCACFYDTKLGRRRVEHHDHAVVSGRLAGENMTGASKPYWHQSMFWSDLGPDVGYEAIGIVDSSLPTVGVFAKATAADSPQAVVEASGESMRSDSEEKIPPECDKYIKKDPEAQKLAEQLRKDKSTAKEGEDFGKGIIFYLRDDIVVGIVLWNVFNRMNVARQVLKDQRKYDDLNEVAKLFQIHEEEKGDEGGDGGGE